MSPETSAVVKKKQSLMRWERVVPGVILLLIVCVLVTLFLDPVLKWVMIKTGQGVFGAQVNIEAVKTELRRSRLSVRGLQVADKSEPMKNLFQWDQATFDFRSLPLLEKKVFIDESTVDGLKFGTPRKTSGALALEETRPGFVGKAVDKMTRRIEKVALDKIGDLKKDYDPKTLMDPNHLKTYQVANDAKDHIQKTPQEIQSQIDSLNAQARTAEFQKRIQALGQGGGSGADAILAKLNEAKTLQSDIQVFKNDLAHTQQSVTGRIQSARSIVDEVKKAREDDWAAIRSKLSLPSFDKASMASALFGPMTAQWGERILSAVHTVRQTMPPKPQSPPPPPRGRARIIEFPHIHELPRFVLAKARVTGEVGQDKPFGFSGQITGITTNPPLYGQPATMTLHGTQGVRSFDVKVLLDHTQPTPTEAVQATYNGFSLNSLSFGQPDGGVAFGLKQGEGKAHVDLMIKGDSLAGKAEIQGTNLSLDPHIDLKSSSPIAQRATQNITASLTNVKAMNVGIGIGGTLDSPDLSIDSNIATIVSDALKNALGAEVAQQEKALRAQFDQLTSGKVQELQGMVDGIQQKYLPQLASQNKVIDDLLAQAKSKAGSPITGAKSLDSLKGLFGK